MNRLHDQEPCLLSASLQDRELSTPGEDGAILDHSGSPANSIPNVSHGPLPADVCTAALRTTEARRALDESFSDLCDAIKAYNEAVRCEARLRGIYGLPFSP